MSEVHGGWLEHPVSRARGGMILDHQVDDAGSHRYCTDCGAPLVDGVCTARCATPKPPASNQRGHRRPRARPLVEFTGAAVVVLLVWQVVVLRNDAHHIRSLVSRQSANEARANASVHDLANGLSARLATLEAHAAAQPDPALVAKQVLASVFTVSTDSGLGSGFVMASASDGSTLVTNFHVVADAWNNGINTVKVQQADETFDGTIVQVDQARDLAAIKIAPSFPALTRAIAAPAVGDPVFVVGSPLGLSGSVASGIVSALRAEDGRNLIQFSAPISPGNSGGPLVDRHGNVIGISEEKVVGNNAEALSFAIPVSDVCTGLSLC